MRSALRALAQRSITVMNPSRTANATGAPLHASVHLRAHRLGDAVSTSGATAPPTTK
jgi:hypothetical protein